MSNKLSKKKNNNLNNLNRNNTLKNREKNLKEIEEYINQDGSGLFDFAKHKYMMIKFNSNIKKIDKQNRKLERYKAETDTVFADFQLQDTRKVKQLTEMFELQRILIVYKLKLEEEEDDPKNKKQVFIQNTKNNIALLSRKLLKVRSEYKNDLNIIKKEIKPSFVKNMKVLKKQFTIYNKNLDNFTKLLGNYDIKQIKDRYDATLDIKGKKIPKRIKSLRKKYKSHQKDYEKIVAVTDDFLDKKNEIMEYLDNISTKSAQFNNHLKGMIGDPKNNIEGGFEKNQIKIEEWDEESRGFYEALVFIENDKSDGDIEGIILDLKSIKEFYQETNIQILLNNVVPKFQDCITTAEESLSFVQGNKKIMRDLKNRYLQLAPAVDLVNNFVPIAQANSQAIDNLIAIKQFLENYDTKNGWEQFFSKSESPYSRQRGGDISDIENFLKLSSFTSPPTKETYDLEEIKFSNFLQNTHDFNYGIFERDLKEKNFIYSLKTVSNSVDKYNLDKTEISSINFNDFIGLDKYTHKFFRTTKPKLFIYYPGCYDKEYKNDKDTLDNIFEQIQNYKTNDFLTKSKQNKYLFYCYVFDKQNRDDSEILNILNNLYGDVDSDIKVMLLEPYSGSGIVYNGDDIGLLNKEFQLNEIPVVTIQNFKLFYKKFKDKDKTYIEELIANMIPQKLPLVVKKIINSSTGILNNSFHPSDNLYKIKKENTDDIIISFLKENVSISDIPIIKFFKYRCHFK